MDEISPAFQTVLVLHFQEELPLQGSGGNSGNPAGDRKVAAGIRSGSHPIKIKST
jgi:hypothetical protein